MKNVTPLSVKYTALLLIETHGKTTTLDVKQLLRSIGYYAEQDEVSHFMMQAADELPLEFTDIDFPVPHREYRTPNSPAALLVDDDDDDDDAVNQHNFLNVLAAGDGVGISLFYKADHEYVNNAGDTIYLFEDPQTILKSGGKVFRMSQGAGKTFYYAQDISRGVARGAHASIVGGRYADMHSGSGHYLNNI